MWLVDSSVGRKVIMSISGLFLIVFLLLHLSVNCLMYVSPEAFGLGCEFMGTPFVSAMVPVLALGFVIHIVYAFILNARNLKARGKEKYAGGSKTKIDWAAKNMLALGVIVLGGLAFHMSHFWAEMQLPMFLGQEEYSRVIESGLPLEVNGELVAPYSLAILTFSNVIVSLIYIVWICALWFHLSHGFWSAFQTLGVNNRVWYTRWRNIGLIISTIVCLGFISIPVSFLLGILG